jgi:hypothetical protein
MYLAVERIVAADWRDRVHFSPEFLPRSRDGLVIPPQQKPRAVQAELLGGDMSGHLEKAVSLYRWFPFDRRNSALFCVDALRSIAVQRWLNPKLIQTAEQVFQEFVTTTNPC